MKELKIEHSWKIEEFKDKYEQKEKLRSSKFSLPGQDVRFKFTLKFAKSKLHLFIHCYTGNGIDEVSSNYTLEIYDLSGKRVKYNKEKSEY